MLDNCKNARELWGGVSEIIDRWLQDRQTMLVQYCDLAALEAAEPESAERQDRLRRLCQQLVDYVSAGHFEIYDKLIREGQEFEDQEALKQAAELFEVIDHTTGQVLDFNDKYLETDDLEALGADLSVLGETLETRFRAEDRMIAVLHTAHRDLVNAPEA